MIDHFFPDHMTMQKPERGLKIELVFEVAEPCKGADFWHDARKIIDFSRVQGWEASDL